jgi:hypothetical protein
VATTGLTGWLWDVVSVVSVSGVGAALMMEKEKARRRVESRESCILIDFVLGWGFGVWNWWKL